MISQEQKKQQIEATEAYYNMLLSIFDALDRITKERAMFVSRWKILCKAADMAVEVWKTSLKNSSEVAKSPFDLIEWKSE